MATLGAPPCARARTSPSPSSAGRAGLVLAAGLAAGLVASGAPAQAAGDDQAPTDVGLASAATAGLYDPLGRDLFMPFDALRADGLPLLETLGTADVVAGVSSADGGEVLAGPDRFASGHSLRLERFRPDQEATPAVVVVRPALGAVDATDPGSGAFAFGAEFSLDAVYGVSPTDNGDNLVQRGLFGSGAQYKIQLDDDRPSCRVEGSAGAVTVRAAQQVQPEQWYRVRCRRVGDEVTMRLVTSENSVKQVWEYSAQGPTGSVSYDGGDAPFSVGGKVDEDGDVVEDDSDQFNGLVDDVFFRRFA